MATRNKATTKSKAQSKAKKSTTKVKSAAKKKPAKNTARRATKPVAKKKTVLKVVTKKAAPKAAKRPVKSTVKIAAKPVERKQFDRAPTQQQKAPMNTVAQSPVAKATVVAAAAPAAKKANFTVGEYVVYPTHGVGKILGHEVEKIGEYELKVFVIAFEKDKMTLRVPVGRAEAAGLRSISPVDQINRALSTLKGRAKIARGMWSRRAQEYEAKINSGNLIQIAEVVRDLHKNVDQSERSYSERMIYETAMHRLCGEVAASERVDIKLAQERLLKVLRKQAAA
jgi:CarD family transcriptional regulator